MNSLSLTCVVKMSSLLKFFVHFGETVLLFYFKWTKIYLPNCMKTLALFYVWWQGMDRETEKAMKTWNPWENEASSWVKIHTDFDGLLLGKTPMIVFDSFWKWTEDIQIKNIKSSAIIVHLRDHSWRTTLYCKW